MPDLRGRSYYTHKRARPSREQAAANQAKALKEANQFSFNHYAPLQDDAYAGSGSSLGGSSASASPLVLGPETTPHVADDLQCHEWPYRPRWASQTWIIVSQALWPSPCKSSREAVRGLLQWTRSPISVALPSAHLLFPRRSTTELHA
ncbi:hypothetical protein NDU88_010012 [Pleurodeles waltl]|uniref:Uncharacterized protein n=1 Tax=Pleurodeles waltl TaxID=8319 RepID=A0AAV7PWM3_PLEWA|nr:hypothetical protein NDU88_010012 [Pleurodeles waltl]